MFDTEGEADTTYLKMVVIGRPNFSAYPVHVSCTSGDMLSVLQQLNSYSPYPLEILAAYYIYPSEFAGAQARLRAESAPRQGSWWVPCDYTDELISVWNDNHGAEVERELETA